MKKTNTGEPEKKIAVFKGKEVRRTIHNNEWWFSVVDVIGALADSVNPRDYWFKMKKQEKEDAEIELSTICRQLKLPFADGKRLQPRSRIKKM